MADELEERYLKPKVGSIFRGQAWVELHGTFSAEELRELANQIDQNCQGLDHGNQGRHQC